MQHLRPLVGIVAAGVVGLGVVACGDDPVRPTEREVPGDTTAVSDDRIVISTASDSVWVGRSIRLTAAGYGRHAGATTFTWTSADSTRLLVDSTGLVTALRSGPVVIHARRESTVDSITIRGALPQVRAGVAFRAMGTGYGMALILGADSLPYRLAAPASGDSALSVVPIAGTPTLVELGAGTRHACGLARAGSLWCWGSNMHGELGLGTFGDGSSTPVQAAASMSFATMTAGGEGATCGARASDSLLYCWGRNDTYQLGREPRAFRAPEILPTDSALRVRQVTTTFYHTCAITTGGTAYCWGQYLYTGSTDYVLTPAPIRIDVGAPIRQVSTGGLHACAVTTAGALYCWGGNDAGQVGNGSTTQFQRTPALVTGLSGVRSVAGGNLSTCAITTAGRAYCWGISETLKRATRSDLPVVTPLEIAPGYEFVSLQPYDREVCGVTIAGTLHCW